MLQISTGVYLPRQYRAGRTGRSRSKSKRRLAPIDWHELLITAYEIGLTTEQFWRTTPAELALMVEAYHRRNRAAGVYFRQQFALLYNLNRGEKDEYLEPEDVLILPGEKPRKKARMPKPKTPEQIADLIRRVNQS